MKPARDVIALIFGLVLTGIAVGALWHSMVGALNWDLIKIVAPLILTAAGILGLALSRSKQPNHRR